MSSADGPDGADPRFDLAPSDRTGAPVGTLLLEALIHVLFEKGLLTKSDALSIVETAAQVKRGSLEEGRVARERNQADLSTLHSLYRSFEALSDIPGAEPPHGDNIYRLRPPLQGDRPEFPGDD